MEKEKKKKKIVWQLQKRKLEDLNPYEFNPRRMTDKGMADLMESIDKFGLAEPIIINLNSNIIIGGHARYFTLLKLKEELCDCYVPDKELTEKEMKELNIRLNKNIAGEWDLDILSDAFDYEELLSWGFDETEIDIKLWEPEVPEDKLDDVPEPQREAVSQSGDIFLLGGKHRILCGDSTKKEDVDALMDGMKAEMVFTDPPYGVDYDGGTTKRELLKGDHNSDLYAPALKNIYDFTIVASEQTNRICYGMEIDPIYIDVILRRYYNLYPHKKIECLNREFDFSKLFELQNA